MTRQLRPGGMTARLRQFVAKWRWITQETASGWLPWEWWHMRVCPFCHGYMKGRAEFVRSLEERA